METGGRMIAPQEGPKYWERASILLKTRRCCGRLPT
jgi:hypothetical protein